MKFNLVASVHKVKRKSINEYINRISPLLWYLCKLFLVHQFKLKMVIPQLLFIARMSAQAFSSDMQMFLNNYTGMY